MVAQRLAPDAILEQTNLTGSLTAITDDPDAPDAAWLTRTSANTSTALRVSFATPGGNLTATQEFRVQVRKTSEATDPTCAVELWTNGVLVSTIVAATAISSTAGVVLSGTWDGSALDETGIECRIVGTVGGGKTTSRATVEIGAVEWNADYIEAIAAVSGTGTGVVPLATATAGGVQSFIGTSVATAPGPTVSASGTYTPQAITGTASVSVLTPNASGSGSVATAGITGTASVAAPAATVSASGTHTLPAVTGVAAATSAAPVASAAGSLRFIAIGDASVLGPQASGDGGVLVAVSGSAAVSVPTPTALASGTSGDALAGTAAVTIPAPTASGVGLLRFVGTGSVAPPPPTSSGSGVWVLDVSGSAAVVVLAAIGTGTGTITGEQAASFAAIVQVRHRSSTAMSVEFSRNRNGAG